MVNNFSVKAHLAEAHQISTRGGGKIACPFCGHRTMSVTKNDLLAKCHHPSCGRFINQYSVDGPRNPLQACLWEFATVCKKELMRQSENIEMLQSGAGRYLAEGRHIHPQVIADSLIGAVPAEFNVETFFAPYREKIESGLRKTGLSSKQKQRLEQMLSIFDTAQEKLKESLHSGSLAFFYTNPRNEILSIRFRQPYTKIFSWFKSFTRSGVFDPQLQESDKMIKFTFILLVEGEFNLLSLQSILARAERPYEPVIALGSTSAVDWNTLREYKGRWVLFKDHDEAGDKLALDIQEHRTFMVTQAPLPDADLDSFLQGFSSPSAALIALQDLINSSQTRYRTLSSIASQAHEIRQNKTQLKEFEVNKLVSRLIIEEMKDRGTFYKTRLAPYYFDHEHSRLLLIHKEAQSMLELLHRLGLNPVETIHGYVLKELVNESFLHGQQTEVRDLFHYHADSNTLYWANGSREILKIRKDNIETVPNGTDGFLFLENPKYEPFQRVAFDPRRDYLSDLLLNQVNFNEEALLTVNEQKQVLQFYFLGLFFGSILKTRPLLCPVAEKGSGKTSLLRRIGQLFMGPGFDVTPLPEKQQDFQVALANNYFLAFDNVDEKCRWLNDTLAICATGGTIRIRTLYTTKEETELRINTFVALNSRTPNYRRDDVAERLLLLYLQPWGEQKRSEGDLNRELLDLRNAFLSWLLVQLQEILTALDIVPLGDFRTSFRIADFAGFCYRIAKYKGEETQVTQLFEKLSTVQAQFTLEMDPLFECLHRLVERHGIAWFNTRELHQQLSIIAQEEKLTYWVRNPVSLGKVINRLKPALKIYFEIQIRKGHGNTTYYSFSLKEDPNHLNHLTPSAENGKALV